MRRIVSSLFATLVALAPVGTSAPALAADPVYAVPSAYSGACGAANVLGRIKAKFRHQVTHVPNLPNVSITDFNRIYEKRYEPAHAESPIARRYCGAKAVLSDGRERAVWYLIEEGMGYATLADGFGLATDTVGSNVEFCVSGFDRWNVYNGGCRVLR